MSVGCEAFLEHLWATTWYTNKRTVRPAKTRISLGIRPVWSESSLPTCRKLVSLATHQVKRTAKTLIRRADAQADLSLRWAHSHFVGFVMSWLLCCRPHFPFKPFSILSVINIAPLFWFFFLFIFQGFMVFSKCWPADKKTSYMHQKWSLFYYLQTSKIGK